jgi:heme exporter protein B
MELVRGAWVVFRKDLTYELGNRETLTILLVFSLAVLFLFNFSFELSREEAERFLPGFLWLTALFASVLGFSKGMEAERRGGMEGLLLAPIPKEAIFLGKASSSFILLFAVELILTPLFFLFLGLPLSWQHFKLLSVPLFLGSLGLAALGTLLANICGVSKHSGILFSLGYFPLAVPILISGTRLSQGILQADHLPGGPWVRLLIVIDLIYSVVCLLLFEYLVEE